MGKQIRNLFFYLFTVVNILILGGCVSSAPPPAPSMGYEYKYEIISARAQCEPDLEKWGKIYFGLKGIDSTGAYNEAYDEAIKAIAQIMECTREFLQSHISQMGAAGWRLVSFEALPPVSDIDFGVEYSYRLVWEKPKASP